MGDAWHREDQPGLAAEKILDSAERAFVERGVARTSMATVAQYAGCSRGTLYRYFGSLHELHLAYVERGAIRVAASMSVELGAIPDPTSRLARALEVALREVRSNPGMHAWFAPETSGLAGRVSRSSEVIDVLTRTFVTKILGSVDGGERSLWAQLMVRLIVSLLSMPCDDEVEERALIECFVAPMIERDTTARGSTAST